MEDPKASKKRQKAATASADVGVALAIWRQIAKSKECSPERMLEIYSYSRDPAYLNLLRDFASLAPADQLAVQHILQRLVQARNEQSDGRISAAQILTH